MENPFFLFLHSLLRYAVLLSVAGAAIVHLKGWLLKRPILTFERLLAIIAVVVCHVQLVIGLILYLLGFERYALMSGSIGRFWKMEHIGTMILAVVLVTVGRVLSRKAKDERKKQQHVAVFYLIALLLMLWAIPWPFMAIGHGRGWL